MCKKAFRINYPGGYLEVNIREFFGSGTQRQFKKWLILARQHCSNERRDELILQIEHERILIKQALASIDALEQQRDKILRDFFQHSTKRSRGGPEKLLEKQCENMKKRIEALQDERWF